MCLSGRTSDSWTAAHGRTGSIFFDETVPISVAMDREKITNPSMQGEVLLLKDLPLRLGAPRSRQLRPEEQRCGEMAAAIVAEPAAHRAEHSAHLVQHDDMQARKEWFVV